MTDKKSQWEPELTEDALKAIIRATIINTGTQDPGDLPFKIKERLRGQATGDLDIDGYIREILAETKKSEN